MQNWNEGCSDGPSRASMHRERTMGKHKLGFVAFDSAKEKHAVAIADEGRDGEVRYLGEIDNSTDAVRKLVAKLSRQYERLHFCYEAGPTGYGLHRQLTDLGHVCDVVAPTMIPKRSGDRVKTNRRDSVTLVKLLRAGELRAIWVPDTVHEAMRDLTRAREVAMIDLKKKRQQLLSFLLRHGRIFPGGKNWTKMHERWLAKQTFTHPAQQIVFQDQLEVINAAQVRLAALEQQMREIVPTWTMAPVVAAYQALRGVSFLVAITFVAEVGDVRRSAGCAPEAGRLRDGGPHHVKQIVAWRALSPSIPRAKRRDPGGRWGLTAQRGQAKECCHGMNADVWPRPHL